MKQKRDITNFGFSTILLGFSMMCIITFAALALLTANSDYRLSQKVSEKNTAYYQVEKEVYQEISQIDSILYETYNSCPDEADYMKEADISLKELETWETYMEGNDFFFHTSKTLSSNQVLEVTLQILYPEDMEQGFYKIVKWQNVTNTDVDPGGSLNLIGTD